MAVIIALLYFVSFLLIWQFVGYPSLMALAALLSKLKNKDYNYQPFISIVVPAYNEAKVIEKRIKNLLELDYPRDKYEVIIVESGSTDNTRQIVRKLVKNCKNQEPILKLVCKDARKGKASAINFGKQHAKAEIVLVTDANSIFDKNVLKETAPHFKNSKVGGVGGKYIVSNPENKLAASESFYWDLEYIMRKGESTIDSTSTFHGELNAWRKNIVSADIKMVSEDLDMAIQIRRAGYKIEYEPEAIVYEPSATTPGEQIKQRRRTALGIIQCIFKHWDYFLFPRSLFSSLIFPSHRTLVMLSPFLLLTIPILYIIAWDGKVIAAHLILTAFTFVLVFLIFMFLRSRLIENPRTPSRFSVSSIPRIMYYVLLNEYLILLAWKDFLLGKRSVLWEKVESTRA